MQGLGNDYVYVNCLEEMVPDPEETARLVSDRHFGVGSDGLILICPSKVADFETVSYTHLDVYKRQDIWKKDISESTTCCPSSALLLDLSRSGKEDGRLSLPLTNWERP